MKENPVKWFGYLFSFAFLIISCAGTELTQRIVDDTYRGKVSSILVIAVTGSEHHQRAYEKEFVSQLKAVGVDAISSEEVMPMPADLKLEKEMILNAVNQHGNDAVIVTHLIGKEDKDVFNRRASAHASYYDYYQGWYGYMHDQGYSSTSTTVRLRTDLYDVETEKLIWSGQSKTLIRDPKDNQIINDVIQALVKDLQDSGLISSE